MEDMTMDMGGAAVVAGVMKTLALRGAKANVVATVGLVENMPSSTATRPGDVITSMKGDTVEIINTDAEGRMVLCDAMWYTQDRFKPAPNHCLLYTSPSPRDGLLSRMPSSA